MVVVGWVKDEVDEGGEKKKEKILVDGRRWGAGYAHSPIRGLLYLRWILSI